MDRTGEVRDCQPSRDTVASQVLAKTTKIASFADLVVEKVASKLHPVMADIEPALATTELKEKTDRVYPPLFDEWNTQICFIENRLESIMKMIERVEV